MSRRFDPVRRWLVARPRLRRIVVGAKRRITGTSPPPAVARPTPRRATPARRSPYVYAWWNLGRSVTGEEVGQPDPDHVDLEATARLREVARRHRHQSTLAEAITRGEPVPRAVCSTVAALAEDGLWHAAWALAEGSRGLDSDGTASALAHGVLCHRRPRYHGFTRAWTRFAPLAPQVLLDHVPLEAADGALSALLAGTDHDGRARRFVDVLVDSADRLSDSVGVEVAGRLLAVGDDAAARRVADDLRGRSTLDLDRLLRYSWEQTDRWLRAEPVPPPAGAVTIGMLDYQSPDQRLATGNGGDYVQSLAMASNLARLTAVEFTGDDGLGDLMRDLQRESRPALRDDSVGGHAHLVTVNRDASRLDALAVPTWTFAFGWYMHPPYQLLSHLPFHPLVRPLFLSFHVNRLELLTDEAIAYLAAHGPIGCRDWTTVDLLLSAGVDAFFSGCVTSTVNAVFPERADVHAGGGPVGLIDVARAHAGPIDGPARTYTHQSDDYRDMHLAEGITAARQLLGEYQRDLSRAVTRRLHAYLPLTSLDVDVSYLPWSDGDVRLPGLRGHAPGSAGLRDMQDGIRTLVAEMMRTLLSGADQDAVRARWRELTAERVAEARRQFEEPVDDAPVDVDIDDLVATCRAGEVVVGPPPATDAIDVAVGFDQNIAGVAAVTVASMLHHVSAPVRLWVMGRGLDESYPAWLAECFPDTSITYLPCDHIEYGDRIRFPPRITVSTMDRLLLPHLLPDVDRVLYLDVDTLVRDDVAELVGVDLEGARGAARGDMVREAEEWRAAGRKLDQTVARDLRRRFGHDHGFAGSALNAGVLVLDLERLRADEFTATAFSWVQTYGMHDQDVMLAYLGSDRLVTDPRWNALPVLEDVDDPAIVHWAMLAKPWAELPTPHQAEWLSHARDLVHRAPPPPRDWAVALVDAAAR